jgi:putative peptidoglycan lipid II flippase
LALFGTSFAVVDLPELSRLRGDDDAAARRLAGSFAAASFLCVPAAVGLLLFGLPVVRAVYQRGAFGADAAWLVYAVLGVYSLGLVPSVASRLQQNVFFAAGDTRTPALVALVRVLLAAAAGAALMSWLDRYRVVELLGGPAGAGGEARAGAVGLAAGSALGAWLELLALGRQAERRRLACHLPWRRVVLAAGVAGVAALPTAAVWRLAAATPALVLGPLLVVVFGGVYLGTGWALRMPEARSLLAQVSSLLQRGRRAASEVEAEPETERKPEP